MVYVPVTDGANQERAAETVYGFGFWGCTCADQSKGKTYSVGLFKVSAPRNLDGSIEVSASWKHAETNNPLPMQILMEFLETRKGWEFANTDTLDVSRRVPCTFTLPTQQWEHNDRLC
jgi:hypothetical protein